MGEIADMMLDGTLDAETGEYIGDANEELFGDVSPGFPISYEKGSELHPDTYLKDQPGDNRAKGKKVACPTCGKKVKKAGLEMHQRDVHGDPNGK